MIATSGRWPVKFWEAILAKAEEQGVGPNVDILVAWGRLRKEGHIA